MVLHTGLSTRELRSWFGFSSMLMLNVLNLHFEVGEMKMLDHRLFSAIVLELQRIDLSFKT